jgi:antitoxin component YwqK of YwqJK toxin-antitoxin module
VDRRRAALWIRISFAALAGCGGEPEPTRVAGSATQEGDVDLAWRSLDPLRSRAEQPLAGEKLEGPTTHYDAEGGKTAEGRYVRGERDGPWTFWYPGGTLRWQGSFAGGVPEGTERAYHANGQIHFEGELRAGKRHGVYRYWYDNGRLELEAEFENDVRHGKCRRWTRDGALDPQVSGKYERGRRISDL